MPLTIAQAQILGPQLRLLGQATLDDGMMGIMLHHPGLAVPNHILVDGRVAAASPQSAPPASISFDATFGIDFLQDGTENLSFLRLGKDGSIAPLPYDIEQLVFPAMQSKGLNHSHLTRTLQKQERPRPILPEMLTRFESFGDNCEFGVFTKAFGNRRPSLFFYGGTSEWMSNPRRPIAHLCRALLDGFEGLGGTEDLTFEFHSGEWISRSQSFGFVFHSGQFDAAIDVQALTASESRRLQFVKRKFLQDLENPWKIFVRRSSGQETLADVRELRAAMNQKGQAWLLWVDRATELEPALTVTKIGERMLKVTHPALRGYERADDPDLDAWAEAIEAVFLVAEFLAPGRAGSPIAARSGYDQILAG